MRQVHRGMDGILCGKGNISLEEVTFNTGEII